MFFYWKISDYDTDLFKKFWTCISYITSKRIQKFSQQKICSNDVHYFSVYKALDVNSLAGFLSGRGPSAPLISIKSIRITWPQLASVYSKVNMMRVFEMYFGTNWVSFEKERGFMYFVVPVSDLFGMCALHWSTPSKFTKSQISWIALGFTMKTNYI